MNVSGDVVGRDKTVTVVGYSPQAVQRLVITVGALVFATAACFFSGGIFIGANVFASLDRLPLDPQGQSVNSTQAAAARFQTKIDEARQLPAGQPDVIQFSEDELSSFIHFVVGPQIGLNDAKARFIEPGRLVIGGRLASLGNLSIAATFSLQTNSERPLKLESVSARILPTGGTFGWVVVPNFLAASLEQQIAQRLRGEYIVTGLQAWNDTQWSVSIQGQ